MLNFKVLIIFTLFLSTCFCHNSTNNLNRKQSKARNPLLEDLCDTSPAVKKGNVKTESVKSKNVNTTIVPDFICDEKQCFPINDKKIDDKFQVLGQEKYEKGREQYQELIIMNGDEISIPFDVESVLFIGPPLLVSINPETEELIIPFTFFLKNNTNKHIS